MFPQCNTADIALHYGKKKKNPKRYKYFLQSQRQSSFKVFGQLLQKERSISLPKAETFTCRKSGRRDITPSAQAGHRVHMWDTPMWSPDTMSVWGGNKLHMGAAGPGIQKILASCCTTYTSSQSTARARASSWDLNCKITGPGQRGKPLERWVFKSRSSSCHLIV